MSYADRSYYSDSRVIGGQRAERKVVLYVETEDGYDEEVELPMKYEVCPTCQGRGSHVNPSIDSHGITAEEWDRDWDDEDRQMYMSGEYDVPCYECGGKRVVETVDESRCSPEHLAAWDEQCRQEAMDRATERMERMMGA